MEGWLVNDTLTCIPGTKTFWHDLLEAVPGLVDKTYPSFSSLPFFVEKAAKEGSPNYVIRNATYFRRMNLPCKQISLLQDIREDAQQLEVCNTSDVTVCNSVYTLDKYKGKLTGRVELIPLGIDFDLFKPLNIPNEDVLPNSILYIGSSDNHPKGFHRVLELIESTDYNFCLVMKDNFSMMHPRVKVFNLVDHEKLVQICNQCSMLICTSVEETQHLSGLEAAACGLPLVTTNVGIYYNRESGKWGINSTDFKESIKEVFANRNYFEPREYFLSAGYDKKDCMRKWNELVQEVCK